MDQTFTADSPELKSQLLRMLQDVLVSESAKKPKMDAKPKIGKTSKAVTCMCCSSTHHFADWRSPCRGGFRHNGSGWQCC